jgi:hypothetical protein
VTDRLLPALVAGVIVGCFVAIAALLFGQSWIGVPGWAHDGLLAFVVIFGFTFMSGPWT